MNWWLGHLLSVRSLFAHSFQAWIRIFDLLQCDALSFVAQNEQLGSCVQIEDGARFLRDDDLSAFSHAHDAEDVLPAGRNGVAVAASLCAMRSSTETPKSFCERIGVFEIGKRFSRFPFGNGLPCNAQSVRKIFLGESERLSCRLNILRNHTIHTS